jgi:hypothetical protein
LPPGLKKIEIRRYKISMNIRSIAVLAILFVIVGSAFIMPASAIDANDDAVKDTGKGDSRVVSYSVPVITENGTPLREMALWTANSDLYVPWFGNVNYDGYSRSRLDQSGSPYDIDKIEVRGRVWKNNALKWDDTDTQYGSSDSTLHWVNSEIYYAGSWTCQGNHAFENGPYTWYPVTSDSWS